MIELFWFLNHSLSRLWVYSICELCYVVIYFSWSAVRLPDVATSINILIDVGHHLEVGRVSRFVTLHRTIHVPGAREPVTSIWPSRPTGSECLRALLVSGQSSIVASECARLLLVWSTNEGREDIRSWKRGVADGSDVSSRVKGVLWFWKRRWFDWELLELCVIFRRCRVRFILDIGVAAAMAVAVSSCCDDSSGLVVVATESVGGLSFLRVWYLTTVVTSVRWSSDSARGSAEVTFVFLCWECGVTCNIHSWMLIMNVSFMFH